MVDQLSIVVIGGSDQRSKLGVAILPRNRFPIQWGAARSYLEFPNHLIDKNAMEHNTYHGIASLVE